MLYSISSALCKSETGNDFRSGILRPSGNRLIAAHRLRRNFAAQGKASAAQGRGSAFDVLLRFFFAEQAPDLTSEPSAERRARIILALRTVFRSRPMVTFCFALPFVVAIIVFASVYGARGSENLNSHRTFFRR
jgi:hypothetical protein